MADHLVLGRLSLDQIDAITLKELLFDNLVKEYIHSNLKFAFIETSSGDEALRIEAEIKSGALGQAPLLNPSV